MTKTNKAIGNPFDTIAQSGILGAPASSNLDTSTPKNSRDKAPRSQGALETKTPISQAPEILDTKEPESLDTQASSIPSGKDPKYHEVLDPKLQSPQYPENLSATELRNSRAQTSKIQETQKPKSLRIKQSLYIPPDLKKWLRVFAAQKNRELSDVGTEALQEYRLKHPLE